MSTPAGVVSWAKSLLAVEAQLSRAVGRFDKSAWDSLMEDFRARFIGPSYRPWTDIAFARQRESMALKMRTAEPRTLHLIRSYAPKDRPITHRVDVGKQFPSEPTNIFNEFLVEEQTEGLRVVATWSKCSCDFTGVVNGWPCATCDGCLWNWVKDRDPRRLGPPTAIHRVNAPTDPDSLRYYNTDDEFVYIRGEMGW